MQLLSSCCTLLLFSALCERSGAWCDAGKYFKAVDKVCTGCMAGLHQPEPGKASCKPCHMDTYTAAVGATSCLSCAEGQYQPKEGSTSCLAKPKLGVPGAAPVDGHHSVSLCPAGRYGTNPPICHVCPKGHYSSRGNSASCAACAAGQYQPNQGQDHCQPCQRGKYGTREGAVHEHECKQCGPSLRARRQKVKHKFGRQEGDAHLITEPFHHSHSHSCP